MKKYIFADSLAIKKEGTGLLKNSEKWPVSEEEFQEFSKYIYSQYEKIMLELDDNLFDMALIDYKFPTTLLQIFHYNYLKNYTHKNSIEILSEGGSQDYLNPDWLKLSQQYSSFESPNKFKRVMRRLVKNIAFNRHLSFYKMMKCFFYGDSFISVGSQSNLKSKYVKKYSIFSDHRDVFDILSFSISNKILMEKYHEDLMINLVTPFLAQLKSNNSLFLKGISISSIKTCWSNRFKEIIPAYINALNIDSENKFLVTDVANIMHRILIIGSQRAGCQVFGFHHGGDFAATILNQMHKNAMSHCKNIVVPTKGIANQYENTYSNLALEIKTKTKYHPVDLSRLLYKNTIKAKRKIKTVMLIGYPMNCQKKTDERGLFFLPKISIESEILSILKETGVRTLYKAHPDRKEEVLGIFTNMADEVEFNPFESSWEKADAFIFTHTSTTTFAFALETDRKVILIDVKTNPVDEELRVELGKSLSYIPARIDANDTMIKFDSKILKEQLL